MSLVDYLVNIGYVAVARLANYIGLAEKRSHLCGEVIVLETQPTNPARRPLMFDAGFRIRGVVMGEGRV